MNNNKSLYEILCVDKTASYTDIKKSKIKLLNKYHPDKAKTDEEIQHFTEITAEINEAYQILSDEKKRAIYDATGSKNNIDEIKKQNEMAMHGIPPEIAAMLGINRNNNMNFMFNPDIIINIEASLIDICKGIKLNKEINRSIIKNIDGKQNNEQEKEIIEIVFASGVKNGEKVIIKGKGNKLIRNNNVKQGNVIVILNEIPHNIYKRSPYKPFDLYMTQKISIYQALLGEFKLNLIDVYNNHFTIIFDKTIINNNMVMKIDKKGININNKIGDLYIIFEIDMPVSLSDDKRKLLKKMTNYVSETHGKKYDILTIDELQEYLNTNDLENDEYEQPNVTHKECVQQ